MKTRLPYCSLGLALAAFIAFPIGSIHADNAIDEQGYIDDHAMQGSLKHELAALHDGKRLPVDIKTITAWVREERRCELTPLKPESERLSAEAIYKRACESVVQVAKLYKCENCDKWHVSTATGFVVGPDGVIVTSAHVATLDERGQALAVRTYDGRMLMVTDVLASDLQADLMVLRVDAKDLKPLPIAIDTEIGEEIVVLSHPADQFYVLTEGMVSSKTTHRHHGEALRSITVTADYAKGSSGGPVLNRQGAVVGIVRTTTPVYYDKVDDVDIALQMVWKHCAPSGDLLNLFSAGEGGSMPAPLGSESRDEEAAPGLTHH